MDGSQNRFSDLVVVPALSFYRGKEKFYAPLQAWLTNHKLGGFTERSVELFGKAHLQDFDLRMRRYRTATQPYRAGVYLVLLSVAITIAFGVNAAVSLQMGTPGWHDGVWIGLALLGVIALLGLFACLNAARSFTEQFIWENLGREALEKCTNRGQYKILELPAGIPKEVLQCIADVPEGVGLKWRVETLCPSLIGITKSWEVSFLFLEFAEMNSGSVCLAVWDNEGGRLALTEPS